MLFTNDNSLEYGNAQRTFSAGEKLTLDTNYRRAHLPLINPSHPDVIAAEEDYRAGNYATVRHSLVLPISDERLRQTATFAAIDEALRAASFSGKVAWDLLERRKSLLHATISSGLGHTSSEYITNALRSFIATAPAKKYRLGGLFMGPVNTGRLYFKVYPQTSAGGHIFGEIQSLLGLKQTQFFLVGYYNLIDHLDPQETQELAAILERFRHETLWEEELSELWLISTHDDLVLSGKIIQKISKPA
ncbi:hypothetical protein [Serratia plymuthica]|uniref:Uncharacterized protein n=1 Tax=Serratia plymuthica TaxID=82996 RepID=A0A2X4X316_SERPL|nr:hypothetical protein [Serratia plymuthica]QPS21998.1 hypothetical protein I6G64_06235 [Serratia plymuthica]QPS63609.1 hypothetical protein I6G52_02025 [Serratia plymuthica]RKS64022.1 hypothetical protein C8E17_3322 [Serratia plymuthica]CAI2488722.1 Uncharacterised protein [Serratia plymuthica]SQI33775.1 Uncharacterised protein [Serratia plymuthica]